MRRKQGVQLQAPRNIRSIEGCPCFPRGLDLGHDQRCTPGREPLLKPQLVPPLRSDQIAKPHVRHLMRNQVEHVSLGVDSGIFVEQQICFSVGDQTPIFHASNWEIGERNVVQLGQRVGHGSEILVVEQQGLLRHFQHSSGLFDLSWDRPDTQRDTSHFLLHACQIANNKSHDVGADSWSCRELPDFATRPVGDTLVRHIEQHHRRLGADSRGDCCLQPGLIKAGEHFSCSSRLEVGASQVALASLVIVAGAVKSPHGCTQ
mmetsp:Transcript_44762/g.101288  ORF Transcript_44762/g.101288 Transcript_44762/m.101288 type:complete len:261 (-) Transcript_44762:348-1130(-)